MKTAREMWEEKLEFLRVEEAKASDPAQKFTLKQQIDEAKAKLAELAAEPIIAEYSASPKIDPTKLLAGAADFLGQVAELKLPSWMFPKKRLLIIGCVFAAIVLFICYLLPCKKACDDNDLDSICKEMDKINKLVEANNWIDAAESLKKNAEKIVNCGYPKTSDYKNAFMHYEIKLFKDSSLAFQSYFNDMKLHQGLCK